MSRSDSRDVAADGTGHDWRGRRDGTDRQRQGHARCALPDLPRLHRAADDADCHVGLLDPPGRAQHPRGPPSVSCHAGAGDVCRERRALRRSSGCCGRWRPRPRPSLVYLHISCAGPLLASGFWLVSTERFDPRTAKRRFGQIAGMGTLGGLLSAVLAERVGATLGAPALLLVPGRDPVRVRRGRARPGGRVRAVAGGAAAAADRPQHRRGAPRRDRASGRGRDAAPAAARLRRAARHDQRGAARLRVQGAGHRDVRPRRPPAAVLRRLLRRDQPAHVPRADVVRAARAGALGHRALGEHAVAGALRRHRRSACSCPGFASLTFARGAEAVFRGSLFRTGYELFYTPMPADDKRAAKSIIDVGFDRVGDAIGGILVRLALVFAPAAPGLGASCCSALGGSIAAIAGRQPPEDRLHRARSRTACSTGPTAPACPTAATAPARSTSPAIQRYRAARLADRDRASRRRRRRRRCRPTCATSCGCGRATAIACCRCCRGRKG